MKRATQYEITGEKPSFISIHALVKRATPQIIRIIVREHYFNPRPREEGDEGLGKQNITTGDFNPRPREEGDALEGAWICEVGISIHALVKRATQ